MNQDAPETPAAEPEPRLAAHALGAGDAVVASDAARPQSNTERCRVGPGRKGFVHGFAWRFVIGAMLAITLAWSSAALAYTLPGPPLLALSSAALVCLGALGALLFRPFASGARIAALVSALALGWYLSLRPSDALDWRPDLERLPYSARRGDLLTLHNVRNFDYRSETDFTPRWETRRYDLSRLQGVDLFLSYWSSPAIAHTILSWDFGDERPLAISIEARRTREQSYSSVAGFFRQYPIYYVVADERDVIPLRVRHRGEQVWLYRLAVSPEAARALLLDYVASIDSLAREPQWYNALTDNCTTTIRRHALHVNPGGSPFDWRFLLNGYIDRMLYERGVLDTTLPFPELRARSRIDARAGVADAHFSKRIRDGLPRPSPGLPPEGST